VQAAALLTLAGELEGPRSAESEKSAARAAYAELAKDFADLADARGRSYAQIAEETLFEYDHLQVGMVAPDFEAIDENGQKFKLSDYRGKVVMLDFWGIW
jgi:cytochrome oxidase Cu insertion factor (SCO1/SenC/PrrC family)